MNRTIYIILLFVLILSLFFLDLLLGSANIPFENVLNIISGGDEKRAWEYIILDFRLPKAFTAILAGAGISIAGLQMQTLFRNPLASPSVLGISHGASLGVAVFVLSSSILGAEIGQLNSLFGNWGLIIFAILGSAMVLMLVVSVSMKMSDTVSILIIGIMFGFITGAIVSILQYFSDPEQIQNFLVWTFGSLSGVAWTQLKMMAPIVVSALLFSMTFNKGMNALLLGEDYARGVGVEVSRLRNSMIITTSILAGTLTAFIGPIAFIGVAVPHLARLLCKTSDHRILTPFSMLIGAVLMLACDIVSQVPGSQTSLPINSITALFGAPVIIVILIRNKKMKSF